MTKKRTASSPREKQVRASALYTSPLTDRQQKALKPRAQRPDSAFDYSDAPALKSTPAHIQVGRFYRAIKQQISLRLDADVLAWFRACGQKYQTYMNATLRREMQTGMGSK